MISLKLVKEEDLKTVADIEKHELRVQLLQASLDEMNGTLQKAKGRFITSSDTTSSIQHDDVTSVENQGIESVNQVDVPVEQVEIEDPSDGISLPKIVKKSNKLKTVVKNTEKVNKSRKTKSVGNNLDVKMAASTNQVVNVPNVDNSTKTKTIATYPMFNWMLSQKHVRKMPRWMPKK